MRYVEILSRFALASRAVEDTKSEASKKVEVEVQSATPNSPISNRLLAR
jgi:hypothetical protein